MPSAALSLSLADPTDSDRIAALKHLQRGGQHREALALAREALALAREAVRGDPGNRELALIEAIGLRHLGEIDAALGVIDRALADHPRFSLLHQQRGLCHVARKDAPAAIEALNTALALNPALPMAWRMLEGVYRLAGDSENAALAAGQSAILHSMPGEVVSATALFADGDLDAAERLTRDFLLAQGDHPEAMRLLARIGMAHEAWDDAEVLLAGVLALTPEHVAARFDYAKTLLARHKYLEAQSEIARLRMNDPDNAELRSMAATAAVGLGRHGEAIAIYRALLPDVAADPLATADVQLWLGHALKTEGDLAEAIAAYRAAAAARPAFGDAWWSLANLKTYRFAADEIAAIEAATADPATSPLDRVHLDFALGKAREDAGDFAASWTAYAAGNAEMRAQSRYRPEIFETNTREQRRVCTPAFFAARAGWGALASDPIFVLGLPRSGSTLIEQILASHSAVEGTQELPDIQRQVLELQGREPDLDNPRYPAALADLDRDTVRAMGERYLASTRVHRALGQPFFIDKMPNNFRHIGLIHLMLPNAAIIDARREPMACCFSNLKQLFASGQEFAYSVDDIARYYRTYLDLMEHWDTVLPGRVLRVCNEDLVTDPEGQIRRMLDHCSLPFEPDCLTFHENKRSVRTPSSEQVRRPINREGLDQWRNFAPWLGELETALGDAAVRWRG